MSNLSARKNSFVNSPQIVIHAFFYLLRLINFADHMFNKLMPRKLVYKLLLLLLLGREMMIDEAEAFAKDERIWKKEI